MLIAFFVGKKSRLFSITSVPHNNNDNNHKIKAWHTMMSVKHLLQNASKQND